jgi:hypothetical protein
LRGYVITREDKDMKPELALSGYAEWFWLMARGFKDVENRSWSLFKYIDLKDLPIRIYLHASKTKTPKEEIRFIESHLSPAQIVEFRAVNWDRYRGFIIGEITIVGQVKKASQSGFAIKEPLELIDNALHSPWFFGPFGFVAKDGALYRWPTPYKGQLGFFSPGVVVDTEKAGNPLELKA